MNPALLRTLSSFLLLGFTTNLPLAFSQEKVHDFQGVPISSASQYLIKPTVFGPTGGVASNSTCQVAIQQDENEVSPSLAVKFNIIGQSPGAIFTGTPLNIAFVDKPKCATSSKWVVVVDDFPSKWLGIGGAQDHPGLKQIITGNFYIQKYDLGYKLVFCPTSTGPCSDITRHADKNERRLVLTNTDSPFEVSFIKDKPIVYNYILRTFDYVTRIE